MAQADWTPISDILSSSLVDNGVTAGTDKPIGGLLHVYGFNSLDATDGVSAYYTAQAGFSPTTKGGSIRGAIRRGPASGPTGFAPFLFIGLQTDAGTGSAYVLGLSDADPYHIILRKGALTAGVVDGIVAPATSPDNIMLRSTEAFTSNAWLHLRMDMIVQGTGDVIVQVFQNDLDAQNVDVPSWVVIPGMEGTQSPAIDGFVDDALQVNTGSLPLTAGRMGFGMRSQAVGARVYFDYMEAARQL